MNANEMLYFDFGTQRVKDKLYDHLMLSGCNWHMLCQFSKIAPTGSSPVLGGLACREDERS